MNLRTMLGTWTFRSIALRLAAVVVVGWLAIIVVGIAWMGLTLDAELRAREFARGIRIGWSEEQVKAYVGRVPQEDSRVRGQESRPTRFALGWETNMGWLRVHFERERVVRVAPPGD